MYYQCRFEKETEDGIETTVGWVENVKGLAVGCRVTLKDEEGFWLVKSMGGQGITEQEFKSLKTKSREWNNNIMKTIYAKHEPYENGHLGEVVDEMKLTGAPTIRVVEFDGGFFAVEGSHRLAAAFHLGLEPKIVIMPNEAEGLTDYWARVAKTLPSYDYKLVHTLDLRKIEIKE